MYFRIVLALAASVSASSAYAQSAQPAPVPATEAANTVAAPAVARSLPASTLITVTPVSEISSKKIDVGDKVTFSVVNDVVENGVVAIPRGAVVTGSITWKTGKAIGGKSGKFEVNFDNIAVRGRTYALRGTHRQEGKGNTAAALLGSIFVSGRSAQMLPGQFANAFTAEAIPY